MNAFATFMYLYLNKLLSGILVRMILSSYLNIRKSVGLDHLDKPNNKIILLSNYIWETNVILNSFIFITY